jgi:predicted alpha/beta superfamily hydrolase
MRVILFIGILLHINLTSFCQPVSSKPFVLGVTDEFHSTLLNEQRSLNIYLPEDYNKNDSVRYPVIYLLDGSADEDFIHVVGLVQFNSFEWVNRIPKSIVVGISNVDRRRDFTFPTSIEKDKKRFPTAGHSARFIEFIEKELQPYIENKYRTNDTKTIIGESLGGLLAAEILLKKPELFNKYIIISPSIWWDNGSLLDLPLPVMNDRLNKGTEIYIAVGKEGLTPGDIPRVMEVDVNLLAEKIKNGFTQRATTYFDYLPQEDHATISHQAILNAMKILYTAETNKK